MSFLIDAVQIYLLAVLVVVTIVAAMVARGEHLRRREARAARQSAAAPVARLQPPVHAVTPVCTLAIPQDGINYADVILDEQQRRVLACFVLCGMGMNIERDLKRVCMELQPAERNQLLRLMMPILEGFGYKAETEISRSDVEALLDKLVRYQNFFWLCVEYVDIIEHMYDLSLVLRTPDGRDIPQDILPTSTVISRLRMMRDRQRQNV